MRTLEPYNPDYFLNRLALDEKTDPYLLDPYVVIGEFFEFENVEGILKVFRSCCNASLTHNYSWEEGSAGNLVYLYERLERLVEACYLLHIKIDKPLNKFGAGVSKESLEQFVLPCLLSIEELNNPILVIDNFFTVYGLNNWKRLLHDWMEAGISNYSVTDNIEPEEIFPYYKEMEKLLFAAYWIKVLYRSANDATETQKN